MLFARRVATGALLSIAALALFLGVLGCGVAPESATTTSLATTTSGAVPVVSPTLPETVPDYAGVDPATGLHVTGTPQVIDAATYRLQVTGKVAKPLSLSYAEILALPKVSATPALECPGEFVDTATWSGVPLRAILELAQPEAGAIRLVMNAADGYSTVISLEDALQPQNFLAYELEGETLPALHGFPLRAVFPGKYGAYWIKWLLEIEVD